MSSKNTIKHRNGQILTGKLWRKDHSLFLDLPFYSNVLRMDDLEETLQKGMGEVNKEGHCVPFMLVSSFLQFPFIKSKYLNRNLERDLTRSTHSPIVQRSIHFYANLRLYFHRSWTQLGACMLLEYGDSFRSLSCSIDWAKCWEWRRFIQASSCRERSVQLII
jgi:hypothetical protein